MVLVEKPIATRRGLGGASTTGIPPGSATNRNLFSRRRVASVPSQITGRVAIWGAAGLGQTLQRTV